MDATQLTAPRGMSQSNPVESRTVSARIDTGRLCHKVKFVAAVFSANGLPPFPYVASGLTAAGVIYTALVANSTAVADVQETIAGYFKGAQIQSVISDEPEEFLDADCLPGAQVYGIVAKRRERLGFWARLFRR